MQKTFLLFLGLALMALPMRAQGAGQPVQKLNVWKMDGTQIQFLLTDEPVTTFENGNLVIISNQGVYSYPLAQMKKYTYEGLPAGIDTPIVAPGTILIRQNNEMMVIDGLPDKANVAVYNVDGKLLFTQQATGGQSTSILMTAYPAGNYIINAGGASFKFVKQ